MQINRSFFRQVLARLRDSLLTHQRWWEVGVIVFGVAVGVLVLYWWMWRPVHITMSGGAQSITRLDTEAIERLTKWRLQREARRNPETVVWR